VPAQKIKATFTEPMLLLPASTLPEGANWIYELKLDGYRALAVKTIAQPYCQVGSPFVNLRGPKWTLGAGSHCGQNERSAAG
jgi:hypothetical protein